MIAVIDEVGNNLTSLCNALERLKLTYTLTHHKKTILQARHIILPGVGCAKESMHALHNLGLVELLQTTHLPILGICLGMQLMLDYSEEENVACLGLIPGCVKHLPIKLNMPVPHMGWNRLNWNKPSLLQSNLQGNDYVYFVHSYALENTPYTLATSDYSESFSAIIQKDNRIGMQFHPEKSGDVGLQLLSNALMEIS